MKPVVINGFFISLLFIGFISCKKKESAAIGEVQEPYSPTKINGQFDVLKQYDLINDTLWLKRGKTSVIYYDTLVDNELINNGTNALDIGNVSLNGIVFKKYTWGSTNLSTEYVDSSVVVFNTPLFWSITGTGTIKPFVYKVSNNYPIYTGYNSLPDTIDLTNGVTFSLNNFSGVDRILVYVRSILGSMSNMVVLSPAVNTVSLTNSDLHHVDNSMSNYGTLGIFFYKNDFRVINGKIYNFRTGYYFVKYNVYLK